MITYPGWEWSKGGGGGGEADGDAEDKTHQFVIRNSATRIYDWRSQIFSESVSFLYDHLHVLAAGNEAIVYLFMRWDPCRKWSHFSDGSSKCIFLKKIVFFNQMSVIFFVNKWALVQVMTCRSFCDNWMHRRSMLSWWLQMPWCLIDARPSWIDSWWL